MFRKLNEKEKQTFRQWARDNYKIGSDVPTYWHPIVRDECQKMNKGE